MGGSLSSTLGDVTLQPAQFRQLQMFMPTSEVVEGVHKVDARRFHNELSAKPKDEWDDIRALKRDRRIGAMIHRREPIAPLHINYGPNDEFEPELWDGHHRLRELEKAKHTEVPIEQHFDDEPHEGAGFTRPTWMRRERS